MIAIDSKGTSETMTLHVAVPDGIVFNTTFVSPTPSAVTTPLPSTVATPAVPPVHIYVISSDESVIACSLYVSPTFKYNSDGEILTFNGLISSTCFSFT